MQTHAKRFVKSVIVKVTMWGLIFWFFFTFIL